MNTSTSISVGTHRRPGPPAHRRGAVVVAVLALVALLAACGGGTGSGDASRVDRIVVGVASLQEQQPDPLIANIGGNLYPVKWSVGEFLVNRDEQAKLQPGLATSWETSEDGLTWTVHLRSGVSMQDGSPFTATDVKTSMDRAIEHKADPLFAGYALWSSVVEQVTVVDPATVRLQLERPYSSVLSEAPAPIATEYYRKVGEEVFQKKPVAAGPWIFESQKQNDSMTFVRFDGFWDATRTPAVKHLVLKIIPDETQRVAALRTGQVDVAANLSQASIVQLGGDSRVTLQQVRNASQANVYFPDLFTGKQGKVTDPRVRRALLMAIDRQGIAKALYGGQAEVAASAYLPITLGYDASAQAVPYDPAGAKTLLAEAGATGMPFQLSTYSSVGAISDVQKLAEAVVSYWQQVGIDAKLNVVDPATYLASVRAHKYSDAVILASPALLVADPGQLQYFYSSTGAYSALKNEQVDGFFAELDRATTPERTTEVAQGLRTVLDENLYGLPLVIATTVHGVGPRVAEWSPMAGSSFPGPFWTLRAA